MTFTQDLVCHSYDINQVAKETNVKPFSVNVVKTVIFFKDDGEYGISFQGHMVK